MRVYEKPPMFLASFLRFMAFRELLLGSNQSLCEEKVLSTLTFL